MNTPSRSVPVPVDPKTSRPARPSMTRPMFWSIRRELWENRSIYIAPLVVAGVTLFGFLVSTVHLPQRRRATLLLDAAQQQTQIAKPYDMVAMMIMATAFIVGVFYSLDALYGERRDRSIQFWKSLPVSDWTTVLSKAAIPIVVLPLLTFAIIVATQADMLLLTNVVLRMNDMDPKAPGQYPLFEHSLIQLYGLAAVALWHAPIYGWLLVVSGWAKRATFLWAVLPLAFIAILEKIALNSTRFLAFLHYRLGGHVGRAFDFDPKIGLHSLTQLTPGRFLATPGLWAGLVFAGAFLALAVRLRRDRGPI